MKYFKITFLILFPIFGFSATFTVVNTLESGAGSLREAIDYANAMSGTHTIAFNIPITDSGYDSDKGIWTINLTSTLNYIIRDNLTIDGNTQTANIGNTNPSGPEICLDGNNNEVDYAFSIINASGITIKGMCIKEFAIGIQIFGNSSSNNTIIGNFIGIEADGSGIAGNDIGIEIIGGPSGNIVGGTSPEGRNVVSGNEHIGIRIVDASGNFVKGNYVGLNPSGTSAMPNYDGISIEGAAQNNLVGGTEAGAGNVVSGNNAYGVPVFGAGCDNNIIYGNLMGTDYTGTYAIPNTYGVLFDDGAEGNILGGTGPGERNILSGNSGYGVFIYNMGTRNNIVRGNYIGTDILGNLAVPNANGIVIDGAAYNSIIEYNLISGNLQQGIAIHITGCDSNYVANNFIGTKADGISNLGNGADGIRIAEGPKNNFIQENIIAFNGVCGVSVFHENDIENKISRNSIFENQGLGIDLFPLGLNENDAGDIDFGPNMGMNFPVIDEVEIITSDSKHRISGHIDTENPQNCTIELFIAAVDNSGHGEGKIYLKSVSPDITGNWADTLVGLNDNELITSTATDENGNTSEFSLCFNAYGPSIVSNNFLNKEDISVYPNPFSDYFTFEISNQDFSKNTYLLSIFDISGKILKTTEIKSCKTTFGLNNNKSGAIIWKLDKNGKDYASGNLSIMD